MNKGEAKEKGKREQEARDVMGLRAKKLCRMLGYEGCVNVGGKKFNKLFIIHEYQPSNGLPAFCQQTLIKKGGLRCSCFIRATLVVSRWLEILGVPGR